MNLSRCPLVLMLVVVSVLGCAEPEQHQPAGVAATAASPSLTLNDQVVDVGCAMCMFGIEGKSECETAIRVNGVVYMATGKNIPDAEDHETGVCRTIRKARVSGKTVGDTFVATSFVVLP